MSLSLVVSCFTPTPPSSSISCSPSLSLLTPVLSIPRQKVLLSLEKCYPLVFSLSLLAESRVLLPLSSSGDGIESLIQSLISLLVLQYIHSRVVSKSSISHREGYFLSEVRRRREDRVSRERNVSCSPSERQTMRSVESCLLHKTLSLSFYLFLHLF